MACGEVHVGDSNSIFQFTIKDCGTVVDISILTSRQVIFKKPDGTKVSKTGTLVHGGSGIFNYTVESGLFDVPGPWKVQGRVGNSSSNFYSDVVDFYVFPNIDF